MINNKQLFLSILLLSISFKSLQAQEIEYNTRMIKPFKADGISNEWNEPLNEYNDATKLAFALANDDKNLYIVLESLDPQTTFSILRGGITLNINTEGKKKKGINLVFPLMERPSLSKDEIPSNKGQMPILDTEKLHEQASDVKTIKISGFKNISDGDLPIINAYGLEAGMVIKPNKDLIYELCIPLSQLLVDVDWKKPLAYNIKINSPAMSNFKREGNMTERPKSGGRGGMGGGRSGGMGGGGKMGGPNGNQRPHEGESENKSADFWIKFKLVKA